MSPPQKSPIPLKAGEASKTKAASTGSNKARAEEKKEPATVRSEPVLIPALPVARKVSSGNLSIDAIVHEASSHYGLDPLLVFSLMRAESSFNPVAISPKGASGLMQLMPATAMRMGVKNIFDVRENIFGGTKYLRWLLDRFQGDVRLALAGYNAGEGAVEAYGLRIPPFQETQNYVKTIYTRYVSLRGGSIVTPPPTATVQPKESLPVPPTTQKVPTYNQIVRFTSSKGDAQSASR